MPPADDVVAAVHARMHATVMDLLFLTPLPQPWLPRHSFPWPSALRLASFHFRTALPTVPTDSGRSALRPDECCCPADSAPRRHRRSKTSGSTCAIALSASTAPLPADWVRLP